MGTTSASSTTVTFNDLFLLGHLRLIAGSHVFLRPRDSQQVDDGNRHGKRSGQGKRTCRWHSKVTRNLRTRDGSKDSFPVYAVFPFVNLATMGD